MLVVEWRWGSVSADSIRYLLSIDELPRLRFIHLIFYQFSAFLLSSLPNQLEQCHTLCCAHFFCRRFFCLVLLMAELFVHSQFKYFQLAFKIVEAFWLTHYTYTHTYVCVQQKMLCSLPGIYICTIHLVSAIFFFYRRNFTHSLITIFVFGVKIPSYTSTQVRVHSAAN